uniref:Uncharacterized protein n=1 Tax=Setaria italica TaxID=4555 RepID=K3ZBB0_SETIT
MAPCSSRQGQHGSNRWGRHGPGGRGSTMIAAQLRSAGGRSPAAPVGGGGEVRRAGAVRSSGRGWAGSGGRWRSGAVWFGGRG